jgi:TIR domain
MGQSVLVFISHSSDDKESLIEPIVSDLEACYINVWLDKKKIVPGENLRKSIFRDGLDKADVVLIFFTEKSLQSSWVDKEIKHVLREETKKGNNFDLNKIISIFDSTETYNQIAERYPELTDDLLHLMPEDYSKTQLGQLISAIWSKYLSLQGGDVATQKQLLEKDKELFQKEKELQELKLKVEKLNSNSEKNTLESEFQSFVDSGKINLFIGIKDKLLTTHNVYLEDKSECANAIAFGLAEPYLENIKLTEVGKKFFKWHNLINP